MWYLIINELSRMFLFYGGQILIEKMRSKTFLYQGLLRSTLPYNIIDFFILFNFNFLLLYSLFLNGLDIQSLLWIFLRFLFYNSFLFNSLILNFLLIIFLSYLFFLFFFLQVLLNLYFLLIDLWNKLRPIKDSF